MIDLREIGLRCKESVKNFIHLLNPEDSISSINYPIKIFSHQYLAKSIDFKSKAFRKSLKGAAEEINLDIYKHVVDEIE
jgi:hypothetical protein